MRQFVSDCIKEVWQWDIAGHRSPRWAYPYIIHTWQCRSEYISERIHDLHIFDSYPWCWEDTLPCIPQIKTEHCWFLIGAHVLCCLFSIASTYMMHPGEAKCAPPATLLCRKAGCGVGQLGMWAISCKQPSTQFLWTHDLVIGARRFGADDGARIQSKVRLANNVGEYTSRSPIHDWLREGL